MKTSEQWWNTIKHNKSMMIDWLQRQYAGEQFAATRIKEMAFNAPSEFQSILMTIADQEQQHADWILEYLQSNQIQQTDHVTTLRYWAETCDNINDHSFKELAAIATHAENMRLERIQLIADDASYDPVLSQIFSKILIDEKWHASAFESMTDNVHITATLANHQMGMNALGLTI